MMITKSRKKLNCKICEICKPKIYYFRNMTCEDRVSPDPDKIKAIKGALKNTPELHQALAMVH